MEAAKGGVDLVDLVDLVDGMDKVDPTPGPGGGRKEDFMAPLSRKRKSWQL